MHTEVKHRGLDSWSFLRTGLERVQPYRPVVERAQIRISGKISSESHGHGFALRHPACFPVTGLGRRALGTMPRSLKTWFGLLYPHSHFSRERPERPVHVDGSLGRKGLGRARAPRSFELLVGRTDNTCPGALGLRRLLLTLWPDAASFSAPATKGLEATRVAKDCCVFLIFYPVLKDTEVL